MSILEEAESIRWKEQGVKIKEAATQAGYPDKDLGFYQLLRFFDITALTKMRDPEAMRKVEIIFEFLQGSEDILGDAGRLNSKLGNPMNLEERLNKMYAHIHSLNLEKGFQEAQKSTDKASEELIKKKKEEKRIIDNKQKRAKRRERKLSRDNAQRIGVEKRKETRIRREKNKRIKEGMEVIRRTRSPQPKQDVKTSDYL